MHPSNDGLLIASAGHSRTDKVAGKGALVAHQLLLHVLRWPDMSASD
jgi:hypothetical protein